MKTIDFINKVILERLNSESQLERDSILDSVAEEIKKTLTQNHSIKFTDKDVLINIKSYGNSKISDDNGLFKSLVNHDRIPDLDSPDFEPARELMQTYKALTDDDKFEKLKETVFDEFYEEKSDGMWDEIAKGNALDYDFHYVMKDMFDKINVNTELHFGEDFYFGNHEEDIQEIFNRQEIKEKIKSISKSQIFKSMDLARGVNISLIESFLKNSIGYNKSENTVYKNLKDFSNALIEHIGYRYDGEIENADPSSEEFYDFFHETYELDEDDLNSPISQTIDKFNNIEFYIFKNIDILYYDRDTPVQDLMDAAFNYREKYCEGSNYLAGSSSPESFSEMLGIEYKVLANRLYNDFQYKQDAFNEVANEIFLLVKSKLSPQSVFQKNNDAIASFQKRIKDQEIDSRKDNPIEDDDFRI